MPKLGPDASKEAKRERVHEELHKFKRGTLHSGSKKGPVVTSPAQAEAIALSEAGMSRKSGGQRKKSRSSGRR